VRLLSLLAEAELTVADLVTITGLAQPRVSTHLGKLRDAGLLRDRKSGPFSLYAMAEGVAPSELRAAWTLLRAQASDDVLEGDRLRLSQLLRARAEATSWPDAVAGQMERHYSPGRTWESTARGLLGLLRLGDVLDGGSGDGAVAHLLSAQARSVTCLDRSPRVVEAARQRLVHLPNVRVEEGDLHQLPFAAECFDEVLLWSVLTSTAQPRQVLAEAARVLRPGGRLSVATLDEHQHPEVTAAYHHVHQGFSPATLRRLLRRAGLDVVSCEVTLRERQPPYFQIVHAVAQRPATPRRLSAHPEERS
jgi:ArsR family transcriptional regulator